MVINLFYFSCSGFLSFHSEVTDKYSFHYFFTDIYHSWFLCLHVVGLVCFLTLYLLHFNSFLWFLESFILICIVFAVQPVAQCILFSCLQTSLLFVDFPHSAALVTAFVIYLKQDSWGALEINLSLFFHSFPLFIKKKKSLSQREPAILSLNSVSFAGRVVYSRVQAIFLPGFLLFCPCLTQFPILPAV